MSDHTFDDAVVIPEIASQLGLFEMDYSQVNDGDKLFMCEKPPLPYNEYNHIVLAFSGGKDSIACLLKMLEDGADPSKIELWHHDVDGQEGSTLMDWEFLADYCRKFAKEFSIPLYFSWIEGGIEGELVKQDDYSKPYKAETPDGLMVLERDLARSTKNTRRRWPQQGASLMSRWCSSVAKIDPSRRQINAQKRFEQGKTLFVTGERRAESSNRARYFQAERHTCDRRDGRLARHVDHWRPVLNWSEADVWRCLERNRVEPPVPYRLGAWGRSSCMTCIFNSENVWATIAKYWPERVKKVADYEDEFNNTISRKLINVIEVGKQGRAVEVKDMAALEQVTKRHYELPIRTPVGANWTLPAGAFNSEGCGSV